LVCSALNVCERGHLLSMRIITIDGESKVCKTTVGDVIAAHVDGTTADAGSFFRGLTHDALGEMGLKAFVPGPTPMLDRAIQQVIASGTAFELRDRGDLHRPAIEGLVTVVSSRPGVQAAGRQWYEQTAGNALDSGVETLVMNGRNPNQQLADYIHRNDLHVDLSLLVDCDPEVAARRVFMSKGEFDPHPDAVRDSTAKIIARRQLDRNRDDTPFVWPEQFVVYEPGVSDPHDVVEHAAWRSSDLAVPQHIYFDTTHLDMETMTQHAHLLADAALVQTVAY
jgi:cytidylate kinase